LRTGRSPQHDKARELREAASPPNGRGSSELIELFIRHSEVNETASDFLHVRTLPN
jgi:hypothetical protein